ncbi:hypothetical protein KOM00_03535 [Geomonas sp. Red69]|uniref:Nif11 domain-containing protein n=1 Tax=Geomonas diazotrophica TaxID=2843197 RepID=A0ABX8JJ33_9BACT|nr:MULTISPECIES: Os1348 family NHLP clan protein [Geomonas]MBU5635796.1 hypothetical protein [Geomonas diazotrophica]QWV97971.1 hypothetical protein KP005_01355 [Geomonas nitrogeniifigens]QXE87102.1 hypothetical protein KP003_01455 [Geomonas nitrogeniifigens]
MSQESVEKFLGRLITDDNFRRQATASLERAALQAGLIMSAAEITALQRLDLDLLAALADSVDDSVLRS